MRQNFINTLSLAFLNLLCRKGGMCMVSQKQHPADIFVTEFIPSAIKVLQPDCKTSCHRALIKQPSIDFTKAAAGCVLPQTGGSSYYLFNPKACSEQFLGNLLIGCCNE